MGCAGVGDLIVFCLQLSGSDVARKLIMMAQAVAKSPPEAFLAYNPNDPTSFSEVNGKSNRTLLCAIRVLQPCYNDACVNLSPMR